VAKTWLIPTIESFIKCLSVGQINIVAPITEVISYPPVSNFHYAPAGRWTALHLGPSKRLRKREIVRATERERRRLTGEEEALMLRKKPIN